MSSLNQHKMTTVEEQFDELYCSYLFVLRATEGTGRNGQHYVDAAFSKLQEFCSKNTEFKNRMPINHACKDDGVGGITSMVGSFYGR